MTKSHVFLDPQTFLMRLNHLTLSYYVKNYSPMSSSYLLSPNRLFALYDAKEITREQWIEGMRQHFLLSFVEIEEDRSNPKMALLERWRCHAAAKHLLKHHTEAELREVFVALSFIDDFPPATFLWNADQLESAMYCFLREKREPVLRFLDVQISRLTAQVTIEYGNLKKNERVQERIGMRRNWLGVMVVESRD